MGTSLSSERSERTGWRQAAAAACALALLAGCQNVTGGVEQFYDSKLPLDHPVDWWHQLQGGPVAAERPPPPGITDPYGNFARIPPRPAPVDFASKRALVSRLTAERNQTERSNQQDPIVFPIASGAAKPEAAPKPGSPPAPPPPATDADTSRLSFDAADATPTATPAAPPPPAADPHPPAALVQGSAAPVVSGPIPAVPTAAPPLPQLPGLPTSDPAPVIARPIPTATIAFPRGSAALPADAEAALRALAARRAGAPIAVAAGGEARGPSPAVQREALPLALQRAGAITAALLAAGVPAADIRAEAVAQGREASARLIN